MGISTRKRGMAAALAAAALLATSAVSPDQAAVRQEAARPRENPLFGRKKKKDEKRKAMHAIKRRMYARQTTGDPYYGIRTTGRRFATENFEAQMRAQKQSRQWQQAHA